MVNMLKQIKAFLLGRKKLINKTEPNKMRDRKVAGVSKVKNKIYIQELALTGAGNYLDGIPVCLRVDENVEIIGKTLLEVLDKSKRHIPDTSKVTPVWIAAGFRGWKPFAKQSYSMSAILEGGLLTLHPSALETDHHSFVSIDDPDPDIVTRDLSHENVGKSVLECLARCKNVYIDVFGLFKD
jgi:hypothetical protein